MLTNAKELFQKNIELLDLVNEMIFVFRKQNFNRGDRLFPAWTQNFSALCGSLFAEKSYFNKETILVDELGLAEMLKEIMNAQEQKDYILLADLLELRLIPFLTALQDLIRTQEAEAFIPDYFEMNMRILAEMQQSLQVYNEREQSEEDDLPGLTACYQKMKKESDNRYLLEQTSQGAVTLKRTDSAGSWYMHSNNSPMAEAGLFAEQYYDVHKRQYYIYGIGLGYHIRALFKECRGGVPITVFESDLHMLVLALQTTNFSTLLQNGVRLVYDPDFTKLLEALQRDSEALVIHYPSLRNIPNEAVKKRMEEYFIQDSSIRNQLGEMLSNFNSNIVNCRHYVDELREQIAGKDVYLLAAGPSLDKNIELLKTKPENSVILVVGTAFRKLIQEQGIRPDFAIFLDASERIFSQLSDLENENVPIIIASTAARRLAAYYKGPKYLVCQEDFYEAEDYAHKNGYHLYRSGGSVATLAFDIALQLEAKRVIALGLDLAYTGNKIHATYAGKRELSKDVTGLLKVKASDGGWVYTTQAMEIYRQWFEMVIARAQKDLVRERLPEFINATEGGAYIEGMRSCTLQEVLADCK